MSSNTAQLSGLSKAKALYEGRDERARELKAEGKQIIGYMCYFAPPEILEAAGLVPYRIRGDIREPVTHADQYVEPYGCPFVRSSFDLAATGRYDFLDQMGITGETWDRIKAGYRLKEEIRKMEHAHRGPPESRDAA